MILNRHWFAYGTHLPVLMKAVAMTTGDVLELGTGPNSTPVLHWLCVPQGRRLVSYESQPEFYQQARQFADGRHEVHPVSDWASVPLERSWDVAFVDHEPGDRRPIDIGRLAPWATLIVVHDTDGASGAAFGPVFSTFRSRWQFTGARPKTTILSNTVDLRDFAV